MTESSDQRADRYRKIAREARALALKSDEAKLVAAYEELADTWERMAGEVTSDAMPEPVAPKPKIHDPKDALRPRR